VRNLEACKAEQISPVGRNDTIREANMSSTDCGLNPVGGLGQVHQVFGGELNRINEELNGALAA
jgi:hypothetical protein